MNLDKTTAFFTELHIPMPKVNAVMAGSTECFGGLLLLIICSRLVSLPLMFCMTIAYVTADNEALHAIFSDPDKFTGATPFLFLLAVVIIFIFGPGKISLDALLFKKSASTRGARRRTRRKNNFSAPAFRALLFVHDLGVGHEIVQAALIFPEDKADVRDQKKET